MVLLIELCSCVDITVWWLWWSNCDSCVNWSVRSFGWLNWMMVLVIDGCGDCTVMIVAIELCDGCGDWTVRWLCWLDCPGCGDWTSWRLCWWNCVVVVVIVLPTRHFPQSIPPRVAAKSHKHHSIIITRQLQPQYYIVTISTTILNKFTLCYFYR